jgi:hypothetical protein
MEEKNRATADVDIDMTERSREGGICACIRIHYVMSIPVSPGHRPSTGENACRDTVDLNTLKIKNPRTIDCNYVGHKNWCNKNISSDKELSVHTEKLRFIGEFKE